jgi:hypothetical protein
MVLRKSRGDPYWLDTNCLSANPNSSVILRELPYDIYHLRIDLLLPQRTGLDLSP